MSRPPSLLPHKTTIELDQDVRSYLERRCKEEGRTLKWLLNNAVRREMLAEEPLRTQPDLPRQKP
jgi:hypothetical protein